MMSSSQVQDPQQRLRAPSLHAGPASSPLPSSASRNEGSPNYVFSQSLQGVSPQMVTPVTDQDSGMNSVYGMPFAFHSGFRPFYVGVPGGPPLQMVSSPQMHAQGASVPHNIAHVQGVSPNISNNVTHNGQNVSYGMPSIPSGASSNVQHQVHGLQGLPHSLTQSLASPPRGADIGQALGAPTSNDLRVIVHNPGARKPPRAHEPKPKDNQLNKRTKVSRACDECRRKKTRCDVEPDHGTCSPCSRANVPCTFARAQLKRGPAKKRPSFSSVPGSVISAQGQASRKRSQSASDVFTESFLPPIEALLNYGSNNNVSNGAFGNPYAGNNARSNSASSMSAPAPNSIGPGQTTSAVAVPGEADDSAGLLTPSATSSFPILVEVACHSSQSPTFPEEDGKLQSPPELVPAKPHTPPAQYDATDYGISHHALIEYYTFVHPTFPLLPDLVADFNAMFNAAGPAKDHLVATINGTKSEVPLGLGSANQHISTVARESHLIALLLTYLRTLDSSWLSVSVAACTPLVAAHGSQKFSEASVKLAALIVAFDRLHSAVYETPSLVPEYLVRVAQSCHRLSSTLGLLGVPPASQDIAETGPSSPDQQFVTAPQAGLRILGKLAQHQITLVDAREKLKPLTAQLQRTPLEGFVAALSKS